MRGLIAGLTGLAFLVLAFGTVVTADTFGTGANQFTIDFVPISSATNPTSGIPVSQDFTFAGVGYNYRMGTYEITNDQWNKFTANSGVPVTGNPLAAYDASFFDRGTGTTNVPANNVSWYEAAQFVNWLNASTGHQAAYKFTGTQGTSNYTFATWSAAESAGGTNLYRHKDAYYFLPTEQEWVKAAYWNGTGVQTYATKPGESLVQGNGTTGTGWNYAAPQFATDPYGAWNVGSGSQELNGTYDMMGNACEWMENSCEDPAYGAYSLRTIRGGSWYGYPNWLESSQRDRVEDVIFGYEYSMVGFRVASVAEVPEPSTVILLSAGVVGLLAFARRRQKA